MNPDVAPDQGNEPDAKYKQWLGNVLFSYATGPGDTTVRGVGSTPWRTAWTTQSSDGRTVSATADSVTITYQNSAKDQGISGFAFTENYSFDTDGSLVWKQTVTNTSGRRLVIGDWGIPVPNNELWKGGDEIYETRTIAHSYIGKNSSSIAIGRPSGQGPSILLSSDSATGSGFEYQDRWRTQEVGDTSWAWNSSDEGSNLKGLNVYYPKSMAIQKTNRGYLESTALNLGSGRSKTLTYRIAKTTSDADRQDALYAQGSLDVAVQPGMVVPYDQQVEIGIRVKGSISSVTAKNLNDLHGLSPTTPSVSLNRTNGAYSIYRLGFERTQLSNNQVTVAYKDSAGRPRSSVLQFFVIDKPASLLNDHANFMVTRQQWTAADGLSPSDIRYGTYDDWMMNASDGSVPTSSSPPQGRRNEYNGYWGLGDDWGLTHGEFLAAKNSVLPVAGEVSSLDMYLEKAVWENLMGNTPDSPEPSYLVYDFWEQGKPGSANDTPSYRGVCLSTRLKYLLRHVPDREEVPQSGGLHPPGDLVPERRFQRVREALQRFDLVQLEHGAEGEQTTPALIAALRAEGMTSQADEVVSKMATKYSNFASSKYPYGSEYSFDNTGEEAVYTLAALNLSSDRTNALRIMRDIVAKTRATRGQTPVLYWYADPTTNLGESWWESQYSAALAGYTMDDSTERPLCKRDPMRCHRASGRSWSASTTAPSS
ncbi:hypothetical protein ATY41_10645 [Leifsonia xyli subsp. xyli]|uniref:Uncharacterized protein n=1 Tax=Leifsonia xyli subsp. xyli TaxID=59736 RepID=A0A1E2SKJ7_LEIXY|nr:DUF5695 domain-containing protein [Leifsonia xyli]ODA90277.1 hypothetical protein ATY41_10645 [Leifsonia xyli subsp. xyli]